MNILMKDVSVSAVCACPFCHLVSDVFVCYCDPASLPHYVSSQHSRSPRRKMLSCKDSLTWTTPDKHHFSSLPHCLYSFISLSLSLSTWLSASLSLSFSFFLLTVRTWILAAPLLFRTLWRESVFDLGISKRSMTSTWAIQIWAEFAKITMIYLAFEFSKYCVIRKMNHTTNNIQK